MLHSDYYLPAEWHPQKAIQISWPHKDTPWIKSNSLDKIDQYFVELSKLILAKQDLIIIAHSETLKTEIEQKLHNNNNSKYKYYIYITKTNDTWARDNSVVSLLNKTNNNKLLLDFEFNAWGGKYPYNYDNEVSYNLYTQEAYGQPNLTCDLKKINYILEGGAIESNGLDTILTTASVIYNPNRNPEFTKEQILAKLQHDLNINNLIILENSFLHGDDTDGHIDQLVRFCNQNTLVYAACNDSDNPNFESLKKLEKELQILQKNNAITANLKIVPLYIHFPNQDKGFST